ncbi:MAG: hypothetical protein HDR39_02890 [Treponema sp.]|nr:hypothetical protein [Treponema sp.]
MKRTAHTNFQFSPPPPSHNLCRRLRHTSPLTRLSSQQTIFPGSTPSDGLSSPDKYEFCATNSLSATDKYEFGATNSLPATDKHEFGATNSLPALDKCEFGAQDSLSALNKYEFGAQNALPAFDKHEFGAQDESVGFPARTPTHPETTAAHAAAEQYGKGAFL